MDKFSKSEIGVPAVKIIWNIVDSAKVIEKKTNIFEENVFKAFLCEKLRSFFEANYKEAALQPGAATAALLCLVSGMCRGTQGCLLRTHRSKNYKRKRCENHSHHPLANHRCIHVPLINRYR
ncbi:hypothetical protein [Marinobacterium nitratireducens]|uniref:hypothetical protein n=1 Tax=Marinobacterium nitratireducens TaxID=518897 RepID=UPI0016676D1D|nr:hypothetical protein [Marinobacterium nitratireducens]